MAEATDPYFKAMESFNEAMTAKQYARALVFCKVGLAATIPALKQMAREFGEPPSVPFVESRAGAIAALFDDSECFALMDAVETYFGTRRDDIDVDRYRADAKLMTLVRERLAQGETTLAELKARVSKPDSARLSRLVDWMQKNGEVTLQKRSNSVILTAGAQVAIRGVAVSPTLRAGRDLANPTVRSLKPVQRVRKVWTEDDEIQVRQDVFGDATEHPLASELRHSGVMDTVLMRDGVWLLGFSRQKADTSFKTSVVVKSHNGETLKSFDIDHKVIQSFAGFERSQIVVLDSILGVHVYDFLGNHRTGFSLARNPEFLSVYDALDDSSKATAIVRCVDVSPKTGEILFTVLDRFWRFTAEGEPICSLYLTTHDPDDSSDALAPLAGKEMVLPEKSRIRGETDWLYFARFADFDDSVFLSRYSGQLLKVARDGEITDLWDIESGATDMVEDVDWLLVQTFRGLKIIPEDGAVESFEEAGGSFVKPNVVVGRAQREVSIFNVATCTTVFYEMKHDVRAVYPKDGRIRVDMTTTYADLDI
ncbi:hypothetical protein ACVXZ4_04220 [Lacisediminihabitans sp. FW035]